MVNANETKARSVGKILMTLAAIAILLVAVPVLLKGQPYVFHILIITMFNIVLALSLGLIMRTGQVPLCQAAFAGIGAYTSTILVMKVHLSFWVSLPLAGIAAGIIGFLIGLPTLNIKGIHFALATFAFGEILRLIFIGWVSLFGGANGISGIPAPDPIRIPFLFTMEFESKSAYYYLALILLLLALVVFYRLWYSPFGRACKAIEESEALSECTGISAMKYKIMAFTTATFFAGLVGCLYAHYAHFVGPQEFGFWTSVRYIVFVIIGGVGTYIGPIAGAVFLTFLPEFLRVAEAWEVVIYGLVLMLTIHFFPKGIKGLGDDLYSRFSKLQKGAIT